MNNTLKKVLSFFGIAAVALMAVPVIASYSQPVFVSVSGLLSTSNNLSDLTSAPTALINLGIGTSSSPTFTGINITGTATTSNLLVTGTTTLSNALSVGNGGTGATTTANALANLGGVGKSAIQHPIQFIIESPSASENDAIFIFNATSTLEKIVAVNKVEGDTVTFNIGYASSRDTATTTLSNLFSSDQTVTSTSTPTILTINASSTPSTNDTLIFWTTAASSTQFTLTGYYSEN